VYELRYEDGGITQIAPPPGSLQPERIWTGELEYSHRIDDVVLLGSVFYNHIENLVQLDEVDPDGDGTTVLQYANTADFAQTIGAEAEVRRDLRQGWMVGATYSFQRTRIGDLLSDAPDARLTNSPEHLIGVRGFAPLVPELLTVAARLRVETPRLGAQLQDDGTTRLVQGEVPVLADLVLSGEIRQVHLTWALGVRNLFDWRYGYPGGDDLLQTFVPQRGRKFFVQTTLSF
jgi:outer membrane receptor protein involved in Fe transport